MTTLMLVGNWAAIAARFAWLAALIARRTDNSADHSDSPTYVQLINPLVDAAAASGETNKGSQS